MVFVPTPANEDERLRALHDCHVLDTPPEAGFDDLTALAARICGAPIALVSLVDRDRQWFKSRCGLAQTETPRAISFCAHAICEATSPMVVPDAAADPRFADSPLVTGPEHIRFYAGMPLRTPDGHAVGTLCVMDRQPRQLTAEQLESLRMLARQTVSQLELRRTLTAVQAGEARFQALCDFAPVGIFQTDSEGQVTYANPALLALMQRNAEEILATGWTNVVHPDDLPGVLETTRRSQDSEPPPISMQELRILHPDGSVRWIRSLSKPLAPDARGRFRGRVGTVDDITEKRMAEIAICESEERYRKLHQLSPDGLYAHVNGRITLVNSALCRMLGADRPEQLLGKSFWDLIHPDYHAVVRARVQRLGTGESAEPLAEKYLRLDGTSIDVEVVAVPITSSSGGEVQVILRDITQRKRDEEALRKTAALLEAQTESSLDGILVVNNAGKKVFQNHRIAELWKVPDDIAADPDDQKQVSFAMSRARSPDAFLAKVLHLYAHPDETSRDEIELKDGTVLDRYSSPVLGKDGTRYGRIWTFRDITAYKAAEAALRNSEERFKLVARAVSDVLWDSDLVTGAVWRSDSYEKIFGLASTDDGPAGSAGWISHIHAEDRERVLASLQRIHVSTAQTWHEEYRFLRRDGAYAHVQDRGQIMRDDAGRAIRMVGGMSDLSEQKKLEAQYLRAQRMESIGTLAGGIAHDLNNVLTPILMSIGLLRGNLSRDPEGLELLDAVETSAQRGAGLVRQVLSFARGFGGERSLVDLRRLLAEIERITKETFPRSIRLSIGSPDDLWLVPGDTTQLHQVLMNLALNARDAMPHGGQLSLSVENLTIDEQYASTSREAKPGPYILLKVSDTGQGIAPEICDRIFEPFFTTKEIGHGTGLGLSTVHAIVKSHGGFVNVYSEVGRGSTFKVYLPADPKPGTVASAPQPVTNELPRGRGELILVIDDEEPIRSVTQQTLAAHGYRVLTAADGAEGVALFAQQSERIAAVITDMMMPIMDGPATIQALLRIRPTTRIIAASGLTASGQVAKASNIGVKDFLPKPYTAEIVLKLLRTVLDRPAAGV